MRALFLAWGSEWPSRCVLTWPLLMYAHGGKEGRRKGTFSLPLPVRPQSYQVRMPPLWPRFTFCMCVYAQLSLTLFNPMDCSLLGSTVHRILQARILKWVAIPFSREVFPTQGWNLGLLYWQANSLLLSHPFNLNYLLKTLSPMQSHWELWFQHMSLRERETVQSIAASLCLRWWCSHFPDERTEAQRG